MLTPLSLEWELPDLCCQRNLCIANRQAEGPQDTCAMPFQVQSFKLADS